MVAGTVGEKVNPIGNVLRNLQAVAFLSPLKPDQHSASHAGLGIRAATVTESKERTPMRRVLLLAGAWCLVGFPIAAQEKGTLELGGFGRFTKYDGSFDIEREGRNAYGGGGRIGYFFSPKFSLEVDGSFNASDNHHFFTAYMSTPVRYWPFHLRGLFHAPLGSGFSFLLGA